MTPSNLYLPDDLAAARRKAVRQMQDPRAGVPDYLASAMGTYNTGVDNTDAALQALARAKGGAALRAGNEGASGRVASEAGLAAYRDSSDNLASAANQGLVTNDFDMSKESLEVAKQQQDLNERISEWAARRQAVATGIGTYASIFGSLAGGVVGGPAGSGAGGAAGAGLGKILGGSGAKPVDMSPFFREFARRRQQGLSTDDMGLGDYEMKQDQDSMFS